MPRALFEKKGNAVWISHLDLMLVFQRAFKRAGLALIHSQGFNPRPSISIALPLSVGIESSCELLDFDLEGESVSNEEIVQRLNRTLISGIRVLKVYNDGRKIKNIGFLDCVLRFEYDGGVPPQAPSAIQDLFGRKEVLVSKKSKNGVTEQNIIPLIRSVQLAVLDEWTLELRARICCQNPSLNPMQLHAAVAAYLPELIPDFVKCSRIEVYDLQENIFR